MLQLLVSITAGAAAARGPATMAMTRHPPELVAYNTAEIKAGIQSVPGMVKGGLSRFRTGVSGMWRNYGEAGRIRKRVKKTGVPATYSEVVLMRRSGEDASKFLQVAVLFLFAPELIPASLYFFPRIVPSTFETDDGRVKRFQSMGRQRNKALLSMLAYIEEEGAKNYTPLAFLKSPAVKQTEADTQTELATAMLKGGSEVDAMRPLTPYMLEAAALKPSARRKQQKATIKGLPGPVLKAACGFVGLSRPGAFGLRRGALRKHLETLEAEDNALLAGGVRDLSEAELREACCDRAMGAVGSAAQLRRQLDSWLRLVDQVVLVQGEAVEPEPMRLRLAAMAAFSVTITRKGHDCALPRMLFS